MKSQTLYERILELQDIIANAEVERDNLQKNCKHLETKICNYSWRPGCIEPKHQCAICNKILNTSPSIAEIKKEVKRTDDWFLKEWLANRIPSDSTIVSTSIASKDFMLYDIEKEKYIKIKKGSKKK